MYVGQRTREKKRSGTPGTSNACLRVFILFFSYVSRILRLLLSSCCSYLAFPLIAVRLPFAVVLLLRAKTRFKFIKNTIKFMQTDDKSFAYLRIRSSATNDVQNRSIPAFFSCCSVLLFSQRLVTITSCAVIIVIDFFTSRFISRLLRFKSVAFVNSRNIYGFNS